MSKNFKLVLEKEEIDYKVYIISFTHREKNSERTVFIEKKFTSMDDVKVFINNYGFNFSSAEECVVYQMKGVQVYRK
jgi:hypothetical protein